jgi:hypothetical protein
MTAERTLRLIWFVTWFNVRMLLASEFFILTTFISPLIFATLAFFLFQSGGGTAGQTLLYVALGAGMMGVWSTTLFGCGGAIAWQRWEGTLELLVNALSLRPHLSARPSGRWCSASTGSSPPGLGVLLFDADRSDHPLVLPSRWRQRSSRSARLGC